MRQLFTGHAHGRRIEVLQEVLHERTLLDARPVLLVAPSKAATDDLVRRAGIGSIFGLYRKSFWGLVLDLATPLLAQEGRVPMSPIAHEALAARVLAKSSKELQHLTPVIEAPHLPSALAQTLNDLRRANISAEAIRAHGPSGPDISQLLETYIELMNEQGLADQTMVLDRARLALEHSSPHPLVSGDVLLLDCVPGDTAETTVVSALIQASEDVTATAPIAHPQLFRLEAALQTTASPLEEDVSPSSLSRARKYVFLNTIDEYTPMDTSLVFFSAAGEAREAAEIARYIFKFAATNNTPFDRMGILLRDPERYQPYIQDALTRADIPVYYTRTVRQPAPSGRAFLALLACVEEGLSAERFAEYLSFGEVPEVDAESGTPKKLDVPWVAAVDESPLPPFGSGPNSSTDLPLPESKQSSSPLAEPVIDGRLQAPSRWEQFLVDAAVVGGHDRWAIRLHGLREELKLKKRALAVEQPNQSTYIASQLDALHHLERFALPLIDHLAHLPKRANWQVWAAELEVIATTALRTPERVLRVLAELRGLDDVEDIDLTEVQRVLGHRLAYLRDRPEEDEPYARVWVGGLDEAAARSFEIVFLPGLAEGIFPQSHAEDPLLSDTVRERLAPGLGRQHRNTEKERARLRLALGAAETTMVASYPRLDLDKGRPRVPSFYAVDLIRAAEGRLPAIDVLERQATDGQLHMGWPAPTDPNSAIDEAEYDLAVLGQTLDSSSPSRAGAGRYLLEASETTQPNPHLVRSLYRRAAQWRSTFGPHDGLVRINPQKPLLLGQRMTERSFSASALQNFSICPYKFYLNTLVRLRPREELTPVEQMDPLIRGSIIHSVLFEWFRGLQATETLPWTESHEEAVLKSLEEAVSVVAQDYFERLAPPIPSVWEQEIDDIWRDLQSFVLREFKDSDGFRPTHAELAFGIAGDSTERDPQSQIDPVVLDNGFLIRGAIDLVEKHEDGRLRITDYKSGRPPLQASNGLKGGEVLQPILYALAAHKLLSAEVQSARLAFCTSRGRYLSIYHSVDAEGQAQLMKALQIIDEAINKEFLPAAPRLGACRWCDYKSVCGTQEEIRIHRKDQRRLEDLYILRRLD